MSSSIESIFRLWFDESGERVEVGKHPEIPGMVEITFFNLDNTSASSISLTEEDLPNFIRIIELYESSIGNKE